MFRLDIILTSLKIITTRTINVSEQFIEIKLMIVIFVLLVNLIHYKTLNKTESKMIQQYTYSKKRKVKQDKRRRYCF